jgi:CHASE2 domain-containing sensor protein
MPETLLDKRYTLLRSLGSGGFGQTFLAEDTAEVGAPKCVVKQFKPIAQDNSFLDIARRLFFSEVEVLKKLGSCDRIPTLLNDFEEDGQFYLVQEYIEGRPLGDELTIYHRLEEAQVISLLRDVLEVLNFVHQNNVIHRDIKPSNLVRRQHDGRLVVIDFGAVKEIQTHIVQGTAKTQLTVGIATEGYGPSEQLAGKPRFNSDIYALGMTAIQALTGLHPSQMPSHPTTGEVIWRDRANVSPWLADILDKMVRYHFNQRFQSVQEVLDALDQTALIHPTDMQSGLWTDETQLPPSQIGSLSTVITGSQPNQSASGDISRSPSRRKLAPAALVIGAIGLLTTGLVGGLRQLGALQPLELAVYDRMVQTIPDPTPDPRLLVVGITEADIQSLNRFPLSDRTYAQAIHQLQRYRPRAIGLDIYRDIPQEPGRAELLSELKAPNIIAITNLGDPITPAPPNVPSDRVGFNDAVLDADNVVRRNLLIADVADKTYFSFAFRLALLYLAPENIKLQGSPSDPQIPQLGKMILTPLNQDFGGYHNLDNPGYQIMLKYRGRTVAEQVNLSTVLKGQIKPEQVSDRVVLIGTVAPSAKDIVLTPYSPLETSSSRIPGVVVHAQMLSQFLTGALKGNTTIWSWVEWQELLWIGGWALLSGLVSWQVIRRPGLIILAQSGLFIGAITIGFVCFTQNGWIPIAGAVLAIFTAGSLVMVYQLFISAKYSFSQKA